MQITGQMYLWVGKKCNLVLVRMKRCLQFLGDFLPIWEGANQVSAISQHSFA